MPKLKFEIPAILLRPRDPNHQTLTAKRSASGAHTDRKKARSRRPSKHKKGLTQEENPYIIPV